MTYSLCLQATYTHIDVGIFKDGQLIISAEKDKSLASKELVPLCAVLLMETGLTLEQLTFIVATQGPAPFTSLRTVITTVNALAYAKNIPLVGVDGLILLYEESCNRYAQTGQNPLVILHAFGNDVYYAYKNEAATVTTGCTPLATLIAELQTTKQTYVACGNGARLHKESLKLALGDRITLPDMVQEYASLPALGKKAFEQWNKGTSKNQLQPLYLKKTL